jgi:arginine decarboxylase
MQHWTVGHAKKLYDVNRWGKGYFSINEAGALCVHPERAASRFVDLHQLVERLEARGTDLPILLRFNGILRDRLQEIHSAFSSAIADSEYQNQFSCIYPIKVNQERHVVDEIVKHGADYPCGLEAGSKPELLAVIAMSRPETLIICNGFKDAEFIEAAMWAAKLGRQIMPVIEKLTELDLILDAAKELGVRPTIGVRVKLAARGSGRWKSSGGYRSKFGLTVTEILKMVERLRQRDMLDCLQLLHFHLGSQITDVQRINTAVIEATRVYADLVNRGARLKYLDVGGGLGVDYDGSQSNVDSSVNYTLAEYANSVVHYIGAVCGDADVPHPHILSECGRALVAYHTVLVFGVLGVSGLGMETAGAVAELPPVDETNITVTLLRDTHEYLNEDNLIESYHDAQLALDTISHLFSLGHLPLDQRALAESLYWRICRRIQQLLIEAEEVPDELTSLDVVLSDIYFCNFSLFQSIPDSWAIKQVFPVMPIHRLDERPTRHAVLGDITCDSDGKLDRFIDNRGTRHTIPLHEYDGSPYYLCTTMLGAYQEILGDLHNLFGNTNTVHIDLTESGGVTLEAITKGDTVREVLEYVHFSADDLVARLQFAVEFAVDEGRLSYAEAGVFIRFFEDGLNGYTYLEKTHVQSEQNFGDDSSREPNDSETDR